MGHYDDIIHLQHPTSPKHPRMPLGDRAAQFAPFAALTGYDAAIKETARLTDSQIVFCQVKIPGFAKKFPWYCHGNSLVIAK